MPTRCPYRKRLLASALALPLSTSIAAHARSSSGSSDPAATALQTVHVTSIRSDGYRPVTVKAGTFRGADVMDVPSTVNVVTSKVLEAQGAEGLYDAVRNTAGVTRQQNGGDTWDQLVIRGIEVQNRTNYRLNGSMPIMNFSQVPMEDKARVEILKGASALYYGFTAPSGIVNYVTKRAGRHPVTSLGLKLDDRGTLLAHADVGRRFGQQNQYGLRLNVAGGRLGNYLDGVGGGNRGFAAAAFDWRLTNRLVLAMDLEYDRRRTVEQVGVSLPTAVNGSITLPRAVDPRKLVGPDWAIFRAETTNMQVRADYALDDNWALTVEAGRSRVERDRSLPIFRFTNAAAVATGAGSIRGNLQNTVNTSDLLRGEISGTFETAGIGHNLTAGVAKADKSQDPVYQRNYTTTTSQNLYNPIRITNYTIGKRPASPTSAALETSDLGVYAIDRIELSPQWQVIGGLRYSRYRSDQGSTQYRATKTTPMVSAVYRPAADLSFYASYDKALEEGEAAPTGTSNQNQRLQPGVSDQYEIGGRWQTPGGTLLSAALFNINRPGYYTNANNVFVADGEQRYRGLELSAQGTLTRQLSWQSSAVWLDPQFRKTTDAYNGKRPENAARHTGSLFLSYALDAVPGLSVNGGAYYTGRRPVNDLNQAWLGGVTLYSAGLQYQHPLFGKQTTWQLNIDNLADKQYWAGGGNRLAAGAPRLIKLGVKVNL
ncbi:MAG: TonB-dependent siderophore receptor [Lautropia sp.]|nr:TonB-dependent siderophore receptor [Lautropia sp.]